MVKINQQGLIFFLLDFISFRKWPFASVTQKKYKESEVIDAPNFSAVKFIEPKMVLSLCFAKATFD